MMTRSRLGKGLGALFPTLPGETAKPETTSAPSAQGAGQATGDGSAKGSAFVKPTVTAQASVDAVHGMSKKSVSRETKRNGGKKNSRRASVPSITLNEVSHPADMFFGSTVPAGAAPSAGHEHDAASSASAASGRNTSGNASKKADDTKKQEEQELLPVQGGYLVELHVRDVGPNLHQPRTIFDEDDLRELAESIKEVGVLQPIVVRKRPMAQIEAAR
ncbi:MAG TPA: chromosome partitioning protein ParB, partial [Bifidobacterium sp.]|nr:chromosome partitioning protein ParB [Bifidobacterium sp.]